MVVRVALCVIEGAAFVAGFIGIVYALGVLSVV